MSRNYVTVMPDPKGRNGWTVASRTGSLISHRRLEAPLNRREDARGEAQRLFPDKTVYVMGDEVKPWT